MALSGIERVRLEKAAIDEGFGIPRGEDGVWLAYDSLGTPALIRLTYADGRYLVATNHGGAVADLAERWQRWPPGNEPTAPAGFSAFAVSDTAPLHHLIRDIWRLARSLPLEPLRIFEAQTKDKPRKTEAERLVIQRIGQDVFRDALMTYWGGRCAVTSLAEPRLLRASHIKPWARCETDAERLDVYNGLLLAPHLDAAFDAGLISFSDTGTILFSDRFAEADRAILNVRQDQKLSRVAARHLPNLAWHRAHMIAIGNAAATVTTNPAP